MRENVAFLIGPHLVEAIQIELPDKGSIIGMLEILRENFLGEIGDILDYEPILLRDPLDDVCVLRVLGIRGCVHRRSGRSGLGILGYR